MASALEGLIVVIFNLFGNLVLYFVVGSEFLAFCFG